MRERAGLLDALLGAMGDALSDVRGKLVDEGWFGRRAAPPSQFDVSPLGWEIPRRSFEEQWAARAPGETPERELPDHGIDR